MLENKELVAIIGFLLTLNGFSFRYIFTAHNKRFDELQKNCAKVAERVQNNVDETNRKIDTLESKVDREIEGLDRDIKKVGEKLGEQIRTLTSELFQKIDQNRIENGNALRDINSRLDRLLTGKQAP